MDTNRNANAPNDASSEPDLEGVFDDPFFKAMNAYRAAAHSGDKAAIASAEDAWREQVRAELITQMSR